MLSDLRYVMGVLEQEANRQGSMTIGISGQQEASEMFEKIKEVVYKYDTKSKRKETLKWNTWVSKCRRARAAGRLDVNQVENNEAGINEKEGNQTAEV